MDIDTFLKPEEAIKSLLFTAEQQAIEDKLFCTSETYDEYTLKFAMNGLPEILRSAKPRWEHEHEVARRPSDAALLSEKNFAKIAALRQYSSWNDRIADSCSMYMTTA